MDRHEKRCGLLRAEGRNSEDAGGIGDEVRAGHMHLKKQHNRD